MMMTILNKIVRKFQVAIKSDYKCYLIKIYVRQMFRLNLIIINLIKIINIFFLLSFFYFIFFLVCYKINPCG